jgi:hypothetical protein
MYSLPARGFCGARAAAAHDRPEVEHVVADEFAALRPFEHVERVDPARVVVVQPGRKHAIGAQLTTMLVQVDVVGIVGRVP